MRKGRGLNCEETVADHLTTLTVPLGKPLEGSQTIIPFPPMNPLRVGRWFLIPCWRTRGRLLAGREQLIRLLERTFRDASGNG